MLIYYFYVAISKGNTYSDFQLHLPALPEYYRAIMWFSTPILPWEVTQSDLESYLILLGIHPQLVGVIYNILYTYIHLAAALCLLPLLIAIIAIGRLNNTIKTQIIFGILMSSGLLFLKGDIDFYRHTAYLLPVVPGLINNGLDMLGRKTQVLIKIILISLFILWGMRQIRLQFLGSNFDVCSYVMKRHEINSLEFFVKAACK